MAWITNTVEEDMEILKDMFWPTRDERKSFNRKNAEAKKWMEKFKKAEKARKKEESYLYSELSDLAYLKGSSRINS